MNSSDIAKMNLEAVKKAYEELKDEDRFKATGKTGRLNWIAVTANVSHITAGKCIKQAGIEL